MKAALIKICLVTSLLLPAIMAYAATSTNSGSSSLLGNYQCKRTDASGKTTEYPLLINKNGDAYTFEWDNDSGYPAIFGTGVMHPTVTNVASVSFADPKNISTFGVELFSIQSDGSLQGSWALNTSNQLGSETCTKGK